VITPLIGLGQPGLTEYEPAFADELAVILHWAFEHLQAPDGGSAYLRLSTRTIEQPERAMPEGLREQILAGAYWLREPGPDAELAICYTGAVAPEVLAAHAEILDDAPGAGILAVTSPSRLYRDWNRRQLPSPAKPSHIERLLGRLAPKASLVTVTDGHPASLSWLGAVRPSRTYSLGVTDFGQSGDIPDLYHKYALDEEAIVAACAEAIVDRYRLQSA
jgi:pyruvate dehydrogenase E1 component